MDSSNVIPTRDAVVTLREITKENLEDVLALKVAEHQRSFVADNARSLAQAHFYSEAWYRAIYADETPVGFVMLYIDTNTPEYFLWRFMLDARYQRHGFGRQALEQVIAYVRGLPNATTLGLSYHKEDGGPEPFYTKLGFVNTGEMLEDEHVMRLDLKQQGQAGGDSSLHSE
jgi:diamine N-acetyltransferase